MIADDIQLLYDRDSSALMAALCHLEMPVFLDSSFGDGAGQRDILTAAPVAYISLSAGVADPKSYQPTADAGDLISQIRELRDKFLADYPQQHNQDSTAISHRGGVHGYIGYPRLKAHAAGKIELNYTDCFAGVYLWNIVVDHLSCCSELLFHQSCPAEFRERLLQTLNRFIKPVAALAEASSTIEHNEESEIEGSKKESHEDESGNQAQLHDLVLINSFSPRISRDEYGSAFSHIKDYIEAGDCYQVNLTQGFSASCKGHPFTAYEKLRQTTRTPFSAYMHWQSGALLSLSPERFLKLSGSRVQTQPIKGTRPRSNDKAKDQQQAQELLRSEKDRSENLMIVDLLRNDLGRVCKTGSVAVDQLFSLESFSNVHHLVSTVQGELREECDAFDLLQACFPGGSITGAPKLRAMEIIEELEARNRRAYCGSVFRVDSNGDMDSSIIIRSLLWQQHENADDELLCWAGGGIVADSEEDAEYQECFDKINSIFKVLQD